MKLTYTCPECDAETELDVEPIIPAKIYGPPENCYPAEGGDFTPTECAECGAEIRPETVCDLYEAKVRSDRDDYLEQKFQERKEAP